MVKAVQQEESKSPNTQGDPTEYKESSADKLKIANPEDSVEFKIDFDEEDNDFDLSDCAKLIPPLYKFNFLKKSVIFLSIKYLLLLSNIFFLNFRDDKLCEL